jgi:predicted acyl esterase
VVEHPLRDAWWDDRNILPLLNKVEVSVYLGCDWQNVPLHLPSTFPAFQKLTNSKHVQVAMLGEHGLAWPWESLHVEALAWFDHWLKGVDTGILDGPRFRYVFPGADGWRAVDNWPLPNLTYQSLAVRADGALGEPRRKRRSDSHDTRCRIKSRPNQRDRSSVEPDMG